ncbi:Transglycosylase SLT domain-containing protein [Actinobaculum suis]|uniref:Lytic transglycosylase n=1 Tax=Actinobaculum suis TaxID=1657 RepID=A0A0K9ESU1_9ACTO|nr:lytic transglycosylase domain-containing protein [Actinobaculum suis]KMY22872.1 hypothetical protein ACU19_07640 [Actinobaculum suis]MDY5153786.1 lytic transglycosylase domain-containing protein [Actinobaculum suis]OCA93915.1 hypothetical protein ACU20_07220 [Actinobaculum suis]OCA94381.1 hypothetical protein ACU21_06605 [Actinobaculum suis]SDE28548.1 Transglycosylase SLT domain-containing protein [Actinobaculum suis]
MIADKVRVLRPRRDPLPHELRERMSREVAPSKVETQEMVNRIAAIMGVNPKLAMAHAYVESGFDATLVSPCGAVGPMQVVAAAGRWAERLVGRELDLCLPADNITAGVAIIRYLQRHTDSAREGIGAYYQGLRSIQKVGPYPSTQKYVMRVLQAAKRF